VGLANLALSSLVESIPRLPVPVALDFRLDLRVLLFTAGLCVITTLVVGLWPAFRQSRSSVVDALKDGHLLMLPGGKRSRMQDVFVVVQLALAYVLLVSSGLFIMTVRAVSSVDLGFRSHGVVLASVDPFKQLGPARGRTFYAELIDRLHAAPGVQSVALAASVPLDLGGFPRRRVTAIGYQPKRGEDMEIHFNVVSSGYFTTMGIPLVKGRDIAASDGQATQHVAVVTEAMARRFWPNQDPIGREFFINARAQSVIQVIGVAHNLKLASFGESDLPAFFLPSDQEEPRPMTVHIAVTSDPAAVPTIVRNQVVALGASAAALDVRTIESHLGAALFPVRAGAAIVGILGLTALLLALVGVYGLVGSSVRSRTREIGIRMALGASPERVMKSTLWRWLIPSALGVLFGVGLALALSRMLSSVLFGVSALYLPLYAAVGVSLLCVAAFTIYVPVRRALAVAPVVALRA
jgi:predicted permease